jgi:glycosyltransferase involved in cell wall biosynthesis
MPLSLLEAMAAGRPAIVTDVAGNAEPLVEGCTGFIAEAPTVQHFDDALERAWQQRAQWPQMGQAAAKSIRLQIQQDPGVYFASQLESVMPNTLESG